jgi:hypothetical protein
LNVLLRDKKSLPAVRDVCPQFAMFARSSRCLPAVRDICPQFAVSAWPTSLASLANQPGQISSGRNLWDSENPLAWTWRKRTQHVELESASSSAAAQVPPRVGRGSCTSGHRGLFLRLTVAGHAVRAVRRRADF